MALEIIRFRPAGDDPPAGRRPGRSGTDPAARSGRAGRLAQGLSSAVLSLAGLHAAAAPVSVREALFPIQVDASNGHRPAASADPEHRPVLVLLEPVAAPSSASADGRAFMVDRYDVLQVVRELPNSSRGPFHLIVPGEAPRALRVSDEVVLLDAGAKAGMGRHALVAQGCHTPTRMYGAQVVIGPFDQVLRIEKAPRAAEVPPVVLQDIPRGMDPRSSTASIVIPELNRQRLAEHDDAVKQRREHLAQAAESARSRGAMLDDDERLKPFLDAAAAQGQGFAANLFIQARGARVQFSHPDGRAFLLSFDPDHRAVFESSPP